MTEMEYAGRLKGLTHAVGNTPLLAIEFDFEGRSRVIYAKAEYLNMTGSIKDRMAFYILKEAHQRGDLAPEDLIIEVTSGNTGIAFSAIGRALGHPVAIFMPDWMSRERINLIKSLGAEVNLVSRDEGGFLGSLERAEDLARSRGAAFLPSQFANKDNIEAHARTTGPEIWWQLRFRSLLPDAFVAGVGTGGTVMGVGRYLKEEHPKAAIHPLEPSNSPTLSTGCKVGVHRIQGISDDFIPPIVDLELLDPVVSVDDGDAILMAQKLAQELGLGVGISSGANFIGALKVLRDLGEGTVVTVFPDDNKKYLTTDLLSQEAVLDSHLAPRVKLRSWQAIKRVCKTCCDPAECIQSGTLAFSEEASLPRCPRRN